MDPVVPLIVVGALVALVAVGCAAIRVVPAGHCGVVFRLGRPVRHRPTGLVAMLPGVERLDLVPLSPRTIEPLPVQVQTRDGVQLTIMVSVLWRVTDPVAAIIGAHPDLQTATADIAERGLRHLVAGVDLAQLLRDRETFLGRLPATTHPLLEPIGVEVLDVDWLHADLPAGPELLRRLGA